MLIVCSSLKNKTAKRGVNYIQKASIKHWSTLRPTQMMHTWKKTPFVTIEAVCTVKRVSYIEFALMVYNERNWVQNSVSDWPLHSYRNMCDWLKCCQKTHQIKKCDALLTDLKCNATVTTFHIYFNRNRNRAHFLLISYPVACPRYTNISND